MGIKTSFKKRRFDYVGHQGHVTGTPPPVTSVLVPTAGSSVTVGMASAVTL